jgi:hypothetical protein
MKLTNRFGELLRETNRGAMDETRRSIHTPEAWVLSRQPPRTC